MSESVGVGDHVVESRIGKEHWERALLAQSACNLSGVVFSFAEAMQAVCDEAARLGEGTTWKNQHAICRLYAEQIMHLTAGKDYDAAFQEAMRVASRGGSDEE